MRETTSVEACQPSQAGSLTSESSSISCLDQLDERGLPKRLRYPDAVELKDIKAIIDLMRKNDLSVFEMEKDGFRLKLQKGIGEQPISMAPAHIVPVVQNGPANAGATQAVSPPPAGESHLRDIVSPMVGTFYRAGSPDAPPYVDVGKEVTEDTVVCIIEAMKVMNEIKAETKGAIAEVVAENGKPVQFGQVLYRVR